MAVRAQAGRLALICAILAVWEASSRLGLVDRDMLPPLSEVVATLWTLLGDPSFLSNAGVTLGRVVLAFVIAAPTGIAVGFAVGEKLHLGKVLNPLIHLALAVPQSVFLPLFMLVFGIGSLQKVVFGVTHAFFVICLAAAASVRSVSPGLVTSARSYGASSTQIYRSIYLPAMLPLVVNGLRLGLIFDVTGVLLAEMYSSADGIGSLIFAWGESFQMVKMLAGVVLVSLVTIAVNAAMAQAQAPFSAWQSRGATA